MTEMLVSTPAKTMIFASRREELRLTKVPRYPVYGQSGQKVSETQGEVLCFRNGRVEIPLQGKVTLEDGRTADCQEILQWLEGHRLNGDVHEGFFKVELAAPAPTAQEMQALVDAAVALDTDKLEEIASQEEAGWNRAEIIRVARTGKEQIELAIEEHAAQQAAKQAKGAKQS